MSAAPSIPRIGTVRLLLPSVSADVRETRLEVFAGPAAGWVKVRGFVTAVVAPIQGDTSVVEANARLILGAPTVVTCRVTGIDTVHFTPEAA